MTASARLDELARRIAAHRATDAMLFEHLGSWVAATAEPAVKPMLASWSGHHGEHLDLWADRSPSVPHLDLDEATATARAELAGVEQALTSAGDDTVARLTAAIGVLSGYEASCTEERSATNPLLDAPTVRVLDLVLADLAADAAAARALMDMS